MSGSHRGGGKECRSLVPANGASRLVRLQTYRFYRDRCAELELRLKDVEAEFARIGELHAQALGLYFSRLQPHVVELTRCRLAQRPHFDMEGEIGAPPHGEPEPESAGRSDARYLFWSAARLLFRQGQCLKPALFDALRQALRTQDIHALFSGYQEALRTLEIKPATATTAATRNHFQDLVDRCRYLHLSGQYLEQRLNRLKEDDVLVAWLGGPRRFDDFCRRAIQQIQWEIETNGGAAQETAP